MWGFDAGVEKANQACGDNGTDGNRAVDDDNSFFYNVRILYVFFLSVEMILTSSWRKRLLTSTTSGNGSEHSSRCFNSIEHEGIGQLSQISMVPDFLQN